MGPDLRVYRPAGVGTRRQQVPPVTLMPWHSPQMAGGSAQGDGSGSTQPKPAGGVEFFIAPIQVNHRRYEALQAFLVGRPDPRPSRCQVQIDPVGDGQPQTPLRIRLRPCPQPLARKSALARECSGSSKKCSVGRVTYGVATEYVKLRQVEFSLPIALVGAG